MADYRAAVEIDADPDRVFDYLSEVQNLPKYFNRMTSARPGDGEEVHVTADLGDREVEGDAWFRVDRQDQTLSWGSEGPNDYHGRLTVGERGTGALVQISLSTARAAGPEIQEGLERTAGTIKELLEPGR